MPAYITLNCPVAAADMVALTAAIQLILPGAAVHRPEPGKCLIKRSGEGEFTRQEISALQAVVDAAVELTPRRMALQSIDRMPIEDTSVLLALVDKINALSSRTGQASITLNDLLAAIRQKAGSL